MYDIDWGSQWDNEILEYGMLHCSLEFTIVKHLKILNITRHDSVKVEENGSSFCSSPCVT